MVRVTTVIRVMMDKSGSEGEGRPIRYLMDVMKTEIRFEI